MAVQPVPAVLWPWPPCTVWRVLVAGLALASLGGLLFWVASLQGWVPWPMGAALVAAVIFMAPTWAMAFQHPGELRFQDDRWWMPGDSGQALIPGELTVAMDLSFAMLLRFEADGRANSRRWLPALRRDWGAEWHALRLAVYSPRARKGGQHGGDGPHTGMNRPD